jgi:protoheme IX farnesyltransferase
MEIVKTKLRIYLQLIKSLQTALLLITGVAGFMCTRCAGRHWPTTLAGVGSLFLAISGSTILNMWYDRDIDAKMERTQKRPLPSGQVSPREVLLLGLLTAGGGVGWALALDWLYGLVVFAGLFFDVVVYTILLKRRTPWSIVWGGVSGGMPVLAGRTLGAGHIEWIGVVLALAILFWIPTHILTFSMRYREDYARAGVPTFPSVYGDRVTQIIIAFSSVVASLLMIVAASGIGLTTGYLRLMIVLSVGMLLLAIGSATRPSERTNFGLFKYASLYMLGAMTLLMLVV